MDSLGSMNIVKCLKSAVAGVCIVLGCTSCVAVTSSENATDTQKVTTNADRALAECGKGNIKSVTTQGFECK